MHTAFHSIENPSIHTNGECPVNRGYIKANPNHEVRPYTTSDSITINISGNAPTTQRNLVYASWYLNGGSFPSGTSLSSLLKLPTGISQTLRINNPTPFHNGIFDVLLRLNPWTYFQQLECPSDDYYYIVQSGRSAYSVIFDQISFNLQYYGELKLVYMSQTSNYIMLYILSLFFYRTSYSFHSVKQTSFS